MFHVENGAQGPGVHPDRQPDGTFVAFSDPEGTAGWLVQEVPAHEAG